MKPSVGTADRVYPKFSTTTTCCAAKPRDERPIGKQLCAHVLVAAVSYGLEVLVSVGRHQFRNVVSVLLDPVVLHSGREPFAQLVILVRHRRQVVPHAFDLFVFLREQRLESQPTRRIDINSMFKK